jgi:hypothetical protein
MLKATNRHIRQAIEMAGKLNGLADNGEESDPDDGCAVLFGVIRDCAYKIKGHAEKERTAHEMRGCWDGD